MTCLLYTSFEWFAGNAVPREYYEKAGEEGKSILEYLGDLAADLEPGESGLIALDWFNGNRSVLSNYNLSGAIIGLTLHTKTEEIYRALVEANIFGSRKILENYKNNGVAIDAIYAAVSYTHLEHEAEQRRRPRFHDICKALGYRDDFSAKQGWNQPPSG